MFPQPQIITSPRRLLVGLAGVVSYSDYQVAKLWQSFMPRRREVVFPINSDLIFAAWYPQGFFEAVNPTTVFTRMAAVEVPSADSVPEGMVLRDIPEGLYAVFHYVGANTDTRIYDFIFREWLPASGYALDHRPHFEVLGAKYKNGDAASEEDIWIPIC